MPKRNAELWYSLVAALAVTAVYLLAYWQGGTLPGAGSIVGHWIGIIGFGLMVMTEVLYSIRKQQHDARWGPVAGWLRFHIVTGLVGPYMVLLHSAMRFSGLAGIVMLLTVVVVVSGIVGRYIYTALPRVIEGDENEQSQAVADGRVKRLASQRQTLAAWRSVHVPLTWVLFATALIHSAAALYYVTLAR